MGQRGRDINLPLESPFDRIAAEAREYDRIAQDARTEPKPTGPAKPSENPVMAFASGAGVQPFGPNGLLATGKGLINLASKTAQLPPGQQSASMTMMGGSAIFDSVIAPLLKLTKPENRAAVAQTIMSGLGNPTNLGVNADTTLKAASTLPVFGPGFEEARRRINTDDPWGGMVYAAGNAASMGAFGEAPAIVKQATRAATTPVRKLATGAVRAMLHGDAGVPIPTRAAAGTVLEEGFLRSGVKAGQRKAEDVAAEVAEEAKGLTDYGASRGTARNATEEELAAANRASGREVAAEATDLEQRAGRQAVEGADVEAARGLPETPPLSDDAQRMAADQLAARNLGLRRGANEAPSSLEDVWRATLPSSVQTPPSGVWDFSTSARPRPPATPRPAPSVSFTPPFDESVASRARLATEPPPRVPTMRAGAGGVESRTLLGPQNTPQRFAGQGIEGPNVRGLFERGGQLQPAQQSFAHDAILELLNENAGRPLTKREGVDVIEALRREAIDKPLEGQTARTLARDAQAADLARELSIDTPAAREAIERMGSVNEARRVLARSKPGSPLSFQLPWYVRAGHALGGPATQLGYDVLHRAPNLAAGEAFRAALLAKLAGQAQQEPPPRK
jgi:hypothetical protein